jgi:hypothetical protein
LDGCGRRIPDLSALRDPIALRSIVGGRAKLRRSED